MTEMVFPKTVEKFLEHYSFKDKKELYTNGSNLIPVLRVEQMLEHYFHYFCEKPDDGETYLKSYRGLPYQQIIGKIIIPEDRKEKNDEVH